MNNNNTIEKIINKLTTIIDSDLSSEKNIIDAEMQIESFASMYNYSFTDPEIKKIEQNLITIGKLSNNLEEYITEETIAAISEPKKIWEQNKNILQTGLIDEINNEIDKQMPSLLNLENKFDICASDTVFKQIIQPLVTSINKTINLLGKMDETYPDKINKTSGIFSMRQYSYTEASALKNYPKFDYVKNPAKKNIPDQVIDEIDIPPWITPEKSGVPIGSVKPGKYYKGEITYGDIPIFINDYISLHDTIKNKTMPDYELINNKIIFNCKKNEMVAEFLSKIARQVMNDSGTIIQNYLNNVQTGAGILSAKKDILFVMRRELIILKANELINYFSQITNSDTQTTNFIDNKIEQPLCCIVKKDTTLIEPIISLLTYMSDSINNYDKQLFEYCQKNGLDQITTTAIYFANNRQDVSDILKLCSGTNEHLSPIMQFKKMSAEKKFRENYHITSDTQIMILNEKMLSW